MTDPKARWQIPPATTIGVLGLITAIAIGFIHIVPGAPGFPVLTKDHFTYSLSIISIPDFMKTYNNRTNYEAIHGNALIDNLKRQMIDRNWISNEDLLAENGDNYQLAQKKASDVSVEGLTAALTKLQEHPSWHSNIEKTKATNGESWYEVSTEVGRAGNQQTMKIVSSGHCGKSVIEQICMLSLSISGKDSAWVQESLNQE